MKPSVQLRCAEPVAGQAAAAIAERRAERRATLGSAIAILVTTGMLAFGTGLVGANLSDAQSFHDRARLGRLIEQTGDAVAALPFEELAAMDGSSVVLRGPEGGVEHRLELSVSPAPDGLRVHAVIIDNRTREAVEDFVAWRHRS
jgi:hypothetical protein